MVGGLEANKLYAVGWSGEIFRNRSVASKSLCLCRQGVKHLACRGRISLRMSLGVFMGITWGVVHGLCLV